MEARTRGGMLMPCEKCGRPSECLVLAVDPKAEQVVRVCPACWPDCSIQGYTQAGEIGVTAGAR